MRNIIITIILIFIYFTFSCNDTEKVMFEEMNEIYFRLNLLEKDTNLIIREDTLIYSFAFEYDLAEIDLYIPVQIQGFARDTDRTYKIKVQNDDITISGVDYKAISTNQIFHANKYTDSLKVTFYRTVDMIDTVKTIDLYIEDGDDFTQGIASLLQVTVQVSDILEKPDWWDSWSSCFGSYHRNTYRQWLLLWGRESLPILSGNPHWNSHAKILTAIYELKRIFEEAPDSIEYPEYRDDNNNKIIIPIVI